MSISASILDILHSVLRPSRRNVSRVFLTIFPLILGTLLSSPSINSEFLGPYLKSWLIIVFSFLAWSLLRAKVRRDQQARTINRNIKSFKKLESRASNIALTIVLILLVLASLTPLRFAFSEMIFYMALLFMVAGALSDAARMRGWYALGAAFNMIATSGPAILSFEPSIPNTYFGPVMISVGLSCAIIAPQLAQDLATLSGSSDIRKNHLVVSRLLQIFLILAPCLPATLVYFQLLEREFLALFLPLILLWPTIAQLRSCEVSRAVPPALCDETYTASLLYCTLLAGLALL